MVEKELLPAGADLLVTDDNKEEFISLMAKWQAERGVPRQTRALLRGLHQVPFLSFILDTRVQIVDRDFLRVFTPDQLELVLSGSVEINLDDWRSNTEYKAGLRSFPPKFTTSGRISRRARGRRVVLGHRGADEQRRPSQTTPGALPATSNEGNFSLSRGRPVSPSRGFPCYGGATV